MSVIKSKRTTSSMEFIATAKKLEIFSIRKCTNFPKRYTFYIAQPIANAALRVYEFVQKANSIYPTNQHEAQLRKDCFIKAYAELNSMVSQIEIAYEMFDIDLKSVQEWIELIDTETRLIKAVIKADRDRYKNLS